MFLLSFFSLFLLNPAAQAQDNTARDMANIKAAYQHLNQRNWEAFAALCDADNFVEANVGPMPVKGVWNAIELYKQFAMGFPDFRLDIKEIAPAGNGRYLLRVNITGTHTGTFNGIPPTGKPIQWEDADAVNLLPNGKTVRHEATNPHLALVQIGYGSMLNPTTQTVMQVYELFGKGDVPGILAMCQDDVVFDIQDHIFDSKQRLYNGKTGVKTFFTELGAAFAYSKFQPVRFVADGEDVFVTLDVAFTHLPTGKKYASMYTHQFRVVNGKVAMFKGLDGFAKNF